MEAYALTDTGRVRERNQDYIHVSTDSVGILENLLLVADGMGGHRAGDYASRFTVEELVDYVKFRKSGSPVEIFKEGIRNVNRKLFEKSMEYDSLSGMGTTLVAATTQGNILYVANIGDSRLYLFRDGVLRQITRDHSYVEELVARGEIERDSEDYRQKKNIITRALGVMRQVEADFFEEELQSGDLILMCSDGLSNMVRDQEMASVLADSTTVWEKAKRLTGWANEQGGYDNISVVVADPQISEVRPC